MEFKCFPGNQESEQTETDGKILLCDKAGFLNFLHGLGLHSNEGGGKASTSPFNKKAMF